MIRSIALVSAVVLLAACQPAETEAPPPAETPAPAPPAAPEAPAVDLRAIGAGGVGPITAGTPFNDQAIAALFPDSDVRAEFLQEGDSSTPIITVIGPDEIALEIQGETGGAVTQVLVQGGPYIGPGGEALLAGWPDLGLASADCEMGEGRFTGQPVCRKAAAANIAYVLSVPNWSGADLPDPTTLNGRARLAGWLWTRP